MMKKTIRNIVIGAVIICSIILCYQIFNKISAKTISDMIDNEEDGTLTGDVRFILYKGDHYHLTVSSDWGEDIFVDTNDVWDNGDHVGISILPESIKVTQVVES